MTDPRILDATGAVLAVGDRVHDCIRFKGYPELSAALVSVHWNYGWRVELRGPAGPLGAENFEAHITPDAQPNTYRAPDLTRITTEETT